jgi:hypothetical protein
MKKTVLVLASVLALSLSACGQIRLPIFTPTPGTGPTANTTATSEALFQTAVAQTLTAFPPGAATDTATLVPSPVLSSIETATPVPSPAGSTTDTMTPIPSPVLAVTDTAIQASTPMVDQTTSAATATGSVPTATAIPANVTLTAPPVAGQVTASPTLGIRKYGTLPPAVPFSQITLINKANTEAYISLQVTMPDGNYSIIEYPVEGRIKIQAPVGSYLYVTWVGGRKMVGEFKLKHNDDLSITLYRDRVVIK